MKNDSREHEEGEAGKGEGESELRSLVCSYDGGCSAFISILSSLASLQLSHSSNFFVGMVRPNRAVGYGGRNCAC